LNLRPLDLRLKNWIKYPTWHIYNPPPKLIREGMH